MMIEIAGFEIDIFYWLFGVVCIVSGYAVSKLIDGKVKKITEKQQGSVREGDDKESKLYSSAIRRYRVIGFVAPILIIVVFLLGKHFLFDGISLPHKPYMNEVSSVVVEHTDYPGEIRERSEELIVKATVAILNELDYFLLRKPPEGEPVVKITYIMKDNTEIVVEANAETVWWNGKTYAIKEEGLFLESCKLLFYKDK